MVINFKKIQKFLKNYLNFSHFSHFFLNFSRDCFFLNFIRGLDMFLWTKYGVNYSFILEFNPRYHFDYTHMFEVKPLKFQWNFQLELKAAAVFTLVWSSSLYLYIIGSVRPNGFEWVGDIPWQAHPLVYLAGNYPKFYMRSQNLKYYKRFCSLSWLFPI